MPYTSSVSCTGVLDSEPGIGMDDKSVSKKKGYVWSSGNFFPSTTGKMMQIINEFFF